MSSVRSSWFFWAIIDKNCQVVFVPKESITDILVWNITEREILILNFWGRGIPQVWNPATLLLHISVKIKVYHHFEPCSSYNGSP